MADYISREAAIEVLRKYKVDPFDTGFIDDTIYGFTDGIDTAISELSVMPAADVRPVVLCRDCHHRDPEDRKCDSGEMERQGCVFPVDDDYFCAYGER